MAEVFRVSRSLAIGSDELEWRFSASGGPGGQHANRSNTKVDLRFDIARSASLGPRQRERLLARFGPIVRVVVDEERSQGRNRAIALERLRQRLAEALRLEKTRRRTEPTRAAAERRLEQKRRRSASKRERAWRPEE